MIYSAWGNYVPMGQTQQTASGAAPGDSPGFASLYSPEAIQSYGTVTAGLFSSIFGGAPPGPPPPAAGAGVPPLLLIGAALLAGILILRAVRK